MKQVSIPPFLGIVGTKSGLRFQIWADFQFFWPKITKFGRFRVPKNGNLDAQIRKRTPLFVANYPQKWWNRHLFHINIIFGGVLGEFCKWRNLGSFLADFPL